MTTDDAEIRYCCVCGDNSDMMGGMSDGEVQNPKPRGRVLLEYETPRRRRIPFIAIFGIVTVVHLLCTVFCLDVGPSNTARVLERILMWPMLAFLRLAGPLFPRGTSDWPATFALLVLNSAAFGFAIASLFWLWERRRNRASPPHP